MLILNNVRSLRPKETVKLPCTVSNFVFVSLYSIEVQKCEMYLILTTLFEVFKIRIPIFESRYRLRVYVNTQT